MKRLSLSLLLFGAASAYADASPLERALGGIEWAGGESSLRLLGSQPDIQLLEILAAPTTTPLRRRRAITLLVYTNTPPVQTFLQGRFLQLRDAIDGSEALELAVLLPVLGSLHLVAFDAITPLLVHPVANLRESVAVALFSLDAKRARPLIRTRLMTETDSGVRIRINRLLAR